MRWGWHTTTLCLTSLREEVPPPPIPWIAATNREIVGIQTRERRLTSPYNHDCHTLGGRTDDGSDEEQCQGAKHDWLSTESLCKTTWGGGKRFELTGGSKWVSHDPPVIGRVAVLAIVYDIPIQRNSVPCNSETIVGNATENEV